MLALAANGAPAAPAASEGKAVAVHSLTGGAKRITYKTGPFDIRPGRARTGAMA
jgi:hypothetical protein